MEPLPRIRSEIDALPFENGERQFLLYDRSGLSEAQLAVSAVVMLVISRFDGNTSPLQIRESITPEIPAHLQIPAMEEIENIISKLDEVYFLDSVRFQDYFRRIQQEFAVAPVRATVCAGSVYASDPATLAADLNRMMAQAGKDEEEGRATNVRRPAPRGVIAPHMDYERAGESYGRIYRELAGYHVPEAVVILGTAHQPIRRRFAICAKDFAVPGGIVRHHAEMTHFLCERCRPVADFTSDLFAHRFEHSVELQAVWLRHIWGEAVRIIPVLAGPLGEFIRQPQKAPAEEELQIMVEALRGLVARGRVMLLASADLAHIGPRFGDARPVDDAFLEETARADRSYLTTVKSGSAQDGLIELQRHQDRYHLCGTGCIYTLKAALADTPGRLLGYQQAVTPELEQAVTCASVLFE